MDILAVVFRVLFCIGRVFMFVKLRAHRATRETLLGGMSTFLELAHIVDATAHNIMVSLFSYDI